MESAREPTTVPLALLEAVDAACAAALDRSRWSECLSATARLVSASACVLLTRHAGTREWRIIAAAGVPLKLVDEYNSRWYAHDSRLSPANVALDHTPVVRAIAVPELADDPFTLHFCDPARLRSGLWVGSAAPAGAAICCWRAEPAPFEDEAGAWLARLHPHVVRALSLQTSPWTPTHAESNGWAEHLIDLWPVGVVAFTSAGRPVYASRQARQLAESDDGLSLAVDGPIAASHAETRRLREAIRHVAQGVHAGPTWLRLRRPSGAPPYEAGLCRLNGCNPDPLSDHPAVALLVSDPSLGLDVDVRALQTLHGLTFVEARLALGIASGKTIAEMAERLEVSLNTARWYAREVRQKLDVHRQEDIVRVVARSVAALAVRLHASGSEQTKV